MSRTTSQAGSELMAKEKKAVFFGRLSRILMVVGLLIPVIYWLIHSMRVKGYYMDMGVEDPIKAAFTETTIYLFYGFAICVVLLLIPSAVLGSLAERWKQQVKDQRKVHSEKEILRLEEIYKFETSSNLKPAILGALVIHLLLIWTVFPQFGKTDNIVEQEKRYVIQRWRPQPPKRREFKKKKEKQQKQDKLMPIPDPTPDEPEPIKEIEDDAFDDVPVADDFFVEEPDEPPGPMIVGGDVKKPIAVKRIKPEYTEIAKALRIEGIVILRAVISRAGDVQSVEVLKGLGYGLDEKAADALKQWKFNPGTLNGRPVDVIFTLTIYFKLTTS